MRNLNINMKAITLLTGIILMSTISGKDQPRANLKTKIVTEIEDTTDVAIANNEYISTKKKSDVKTTNITTNSDEPIELLSLSSNFNSNQKLNGTETITKEITISFAGDCTLGNDKKVTYFNDMVASKQNDYSYFLKNVKSIFENDDYTLVNLETTFTDATQYADKQFNFKGNFEYVNILKAGNVEGVNISNNHTKDYLEKGYTDTIKTLECANIDYSGDDYIHIENIEDITVGFIGFKNANLTFENIDNKILEISKHNPQIIIASCHWGVEGENEFNSDQQSIAHYLIDNGVDIVIGHHPHVLQGIETYKEKHIIYSLGNFCFGGNRNPKDKDSMIVQETFILENNELVGTNIEIIPCSISSTSDYNNFQPTPLTGEEKDRVLNKVLKYSYNFSYENK